MREQMQPGGAFDVLYEGFMRPVGSAYAKVIAAFHRNHRQLPEIRM